MFADWPSDVRLKLNYGNVKTLLPGFQNISIRDIQDQKATEQSVLAYDITDKFT